MANDGTGTAADNSKRLQLNGGGPVKLWCLVLLCALPAQQAAAACVFTSNLSPFRASATALVDDQALPAPEVESVSVTRGTGGGASCDQMGFVSVKLRWPRGSDYDLDEVGFEYRVVQGQAPEGLLPAGLVSAPASGRKAEHLFTWDDVLPGRQQAMHLQLEVRAVTPDSRRGPPAMLRVDASPGS